MGSTRATSRGNHRPKSGHATAYVVRFVHMILRKLGPLPYVLVYNTQFGVYPFWCKVYVHRIHCVYGHSGVDNKDKLYTF